MSCGPPEFFVIKMHNLKGGIWLYSWEHNYRFYMDYNMNSKGGGTSQDLDNQGTFEALTRLKFNENCLLWPMFLSYSLFGPKSTVKCVYSRVLNNDHEFGWISFKWAVSRTSFWICYCDFCYDKSLLHKSVWLSRHNSPIYGEYETQ